MGNLDRGRYTGEASLDLSSAADLHVTPELCRGSSCPSFLRRVVERQNTRAGLCLTMRTERARKLFWALSSLKDCSSQRITGKPDTDGLPEFWNGTIVPTVTGGACTWDTAGNGKLPRSVGVSQDYLETDGQDSGYLVVVKTHGPDAEFLCQPPHGDACETLSIGESKGGGCDFFTVTIPGA